MPGGNKYRGTVAQALSAAALPAEVVTEISEMVKRGWDRGQVEISRVGIFAPDRRRNFGKSALAMGFGNSLCFDMRVNFKPGHVEYASLYEATDRAGKTYTVMVPYVCQNVAVLGERYEADDSTPKLSEPTTWTMIALDVQAEHWFSVAAGRGAADAVRNLEVLRSTPDGPDTPQAAAVNLLHPALTKASCWRSTRAVRN